MPLYFLSTLAYLWLPAALLWLVLGRKIDRTSRESFLLTLAVIYPVSVLMEYVYLHFDIWSFSEKMDPLLGPRIYGAPIEEFSFWFGVTPLLLLYYLGFERLFRGGRGDA